jgi:hypothetical protein
MMAKNMLDRYQSAQDVADVLTEWLADRGKSLGGGDLAGRSDSRLDSGVGSDVLRRFSMPTPSPLPGTAPSSETLSSSSRDTARLTDEPSGTSAIDEDMSLAPLEEEASVISSFDVNPTPLPVDENDPEATGKSKPKSASSKSLVEEEFHDPESDAIARRVAQRAQYNPLQPPGYTGPRQSTPWGVILAIGGGVLLLMLLFVVLLSGF